MAWAKRATARLIEPATAGDNLYALSDWRVILILYAVIICLGLAFKPAKLLGASALEPLRSRSAYVMALAVNVFVVSLPGRFDASEDILTAPPWPTLFNPAGFAFAASLCSRGVDRDIPPLRSAPHNRAARAHTDLGRDLPRRARRRSRSRPRARRCARRRGRDARVARSQLRASAVVRRLPAVGALAPVALIAVPCRDRRVPVPRAARACRRGHRRAARRRMAALAPPRLCVLLHFIRESAR